MFILSGDHIANGVGVESRKLVLSEAEGDLRSLSAMRQSQATVY